ncbi:50S ribosomal protein L21e [Candidatus Woesearchaeota archaeon]|nr:50S ribosomal protein L21e [Candidatus Woesearchaeota archaeon]
MVKRIGSTYRKSKFKIQQTIRERGKISLSRYFQTFTQGEKVGLKIQGNVTKGRFHPRFHGLTGTVTGTMKGLCYEVLIHDGDKEKILYVHPIHLLKVQ